MRMDSNASGIRSGDQLKEETAEKLGMSVAMLNRLRGSLTILWVQKG